MCPLERGPMKNSAIEKRFKRICIAVLVVVFVLVVITHAVFGIVTEKNAEKTNNVMLGQVIAIMDSNREEENLLMESLKDEYIIRAKMVSYVLAYNEAAEADTKELAKIANMLSIDEIHIFDQNGVMIAGTNPEYYGLTFEDGEQVSFFKPMLQDKSLTMCQDVMPNTAVGKSMMYAITWDEDQCKMVQVGIEPVRLLKELKENELENVVKDMPMYEGQSVFVADAKTQEILATNNTTFAELGKGLSEYNILLEGVDLSQIYTWHANVAKEDSMCTFVQHGDYVVGVVQNIRRSLQNTWFFVGMVALYLLIAAGVLLYVLRETLFLRKEQEKQVRILVSMSEIYYSMHLIDLRSNKVYEYAAKNQVKEVADHYKGKDAEQAMHDVMFATMSDEYLEMGMVFSEVSTLAERLRDRKFIYMDLLGKNVGWVRMTFITIETDEEGTPVTAMVTTQIIDEEKRREEMLMRESNTDELTQCYNRRAYEDDVRLYPDIPPEEDFVFVSLDVNGLKVVNDSLGHAAGDELLVGASECMKRCFGTSGKVYRTGGDEFVAMIFANEDRLEEIKEDFEETMNAWTGKTVDSLSISSGYVAKREFPTTTVVEMAKIADERMYEKKTKHYAEKGIDRKGLQLAHKTLCTMYTKILKINLTTDSYSIVNMPEEEKHESKGFSDKISEWLHQFGKSGLVHEEDLPEYLEKTELDYMKQHFALGHKQLSVVYRRMIDGEYRWAIMDMVCADDYQKDNMSLFLYVRSIDD